MYFPYFENFVVNWIGTNYIVNFAENYPESALIGVRYGDLNTLESDNSKSGRHLDKLLEPSVGKSDDVLPET